MRKTMEKDSTSFCCLQNNNYAVLIFTLNIFIVYCCEIFLKKSTKLVNHKKKITYSLEFSDKSFYYHKIVSYRCMYNKYD